MNTKHKIQSFSLTEIILAMIITVIVIGMAFSVLVLVQKQMNTIRNNFNETSEINQLNQILWHDFQKYQDVSFNKTERVLKFKTNQDSLIYKFEDQFILRAKDTIGVLTKNVIPMFNNKERFDKIDALRIDFKTKKRYNYIFIYKLNDSYQLMTK